MALTSGAYTGAGIPGSGVLVASQVGMVEGSSRRRRRRRNELDCLERATEACDSACKARYGTCCQSITGLNSVTCTAAGYSCMQDSGDCLPVVWGP
jgi:hypothetical protein